MNDIYKYINDKFDRRNVIDKISEISKELEEEELKPIEEQDKEKRLKLINRQFMEGLKLSTGFNNFW